MLTQLSNSQSFGSQENNQRKKKTPGMDVIFSFPHNPLFLLPLKLETLWSRTCVVQRNFKAFLYKSKSAVTLYGNSHNNLTAQSGKLSIYVFLTCHEAIGKLGCLCRRAVWIWTAVVRDHSRLTKLNRTGERTPESKRWNRHVMLPTRVHWWSSCQDDDV